MKSYNIILIHIIYLFSSFIFSQISTHELLIKREVETLREESKNKTRKSLIDFQKESEYSDSLISELSDSLIIDKAFKTKNKNYKRNQLAHYGYEILNNFNKRNIWANKLPPREYILNTGDEVIIEIWGDTQLRSSHIIDRYGNIYIDKIGQINLSGLALKDLQSKFINKFKNVYSSLAGPDQTAYIDISLGKLKSINITFLGESRSPGIHAIHPFSTIITSLMQIGGINRLGSLRDIQVIRNGKKIISLDFYDYLLNGNAETDIRLLDGDILFVPIRYSTINFSGEIMRPAKYEVLPDETLDDIIQFAGGLTPTSHRVVKVYRQANSINPATSHLIDIDSQQSFILKNGDAIEVYRYNTSEHNIYIYGQVKNPGSYAFDTEKETTLMDILRFAGGIDDETFINTIYKNVGEIIRNHPETNFPEIIEFNIEKLISGDLTENKILQNWDIILIRENPNYKTPKKVTLLGEVNVPGIYTLQRKGENLNDMLIRAGGFTDQAFHSGIQLYRNNNQVALSNFDIALLDGDSLLVPLHPGVVQVLGEVNRSGHIQFDRKKNLKNYIENAGGLTQNADKNNITIIYANGDVRVKKRFGSLEIEEGATIIVNLKLNEEPFDITEFTTNLASIVTSLATLVLLQNNIQ